MCVWCGGFIVALAKEALNKAEELPLTEGLQYERRLFYSTFATVRIVTLLFSLFSLSLSLSLSFFFFVCVWCVV